uniref:Uncharacterized protein n=1 Tax=Trichuris muris TaxID=70415 RepID=A0A5S6Q6C1_TRIMR
MGMAPFVSFETLLRKDVIQNFTVDIPKSRNPGEQTESPALSGAEGAAPSGSLFGRNTLRSFVTSSNSLPKGATRIGTLPWPPKRSARRAQPSQSVLKSSRSSAAQDTFALLAVVGPAGEVICISILYLLAHELGAPTGIRKRKSLVVIEWAPNENYPPASCGNVGAEQLANAAAKELTQAASASKELMGFVVRSMGNLSRATPEELSGVT